MEVCEAKRLKEREEENQRLIPFAAAISDSLRGISG
jgi:hypothetical protein